MVVEVPDPGQVKNNDELKSRVTRVRETLDTLPPGIFTGKGNFRAVPVKITCNQSVAPATASTGCPVLSVKGLGDCSRQGCPECKQTGFRGRQGVFELMMLDHRFHDPIVRRAGAPEYMQLARDGGMRTMFEDGVLKSVQGTTTLEELMRVTRLSNR